MKFGVYKNEQQKIKITVHVVTGKCTIISLCPLLSSQYVGIVLQMHGGQGILNIDRYE
jgi:hypothetical protein